MTSEVKKDGFLKRDLKPALSVFGRTVLAALMAFFVFMSIEVVVAGVFTERIGYHVWEVDEQMQVVRDLGEFYHENIDDVYKKLQELGYPVEGLTSSTTAAGATTATGDAATTTATGGTTTTTAPAIRLRTQEIFSKVDPVVHTASYVVSQICMFLIFASMVYTGVWTLGSKDRNLVQFGHAAADPWRGLRVGLWASVPSACGFIVLLLSKCGLVWPTYVQSYRFFHFAYFPLYLTVVPNEIKLTPDLPWTSILVLLLFILSVPAITTLAYRLGYREFSIAEHFIYVNKKKKKK